MELDSVDEYVANYYTREQLVAILGLIKGTQFETVVMLCIVYGLRISEAVGLQWSAVDFGGHALTVRHVVTGQGKRLKGKNRTKRKSSYRTFALSEGVEAHLKWVKQRQAEMRMLLHGKYVESDYVCTWEDGRLLQPAFISRKLKELLTEHQQELGIPPYRFHDLRHSAASLLVNEGSSLAQIGAFLGHSNPATTWRYAHVDARSTESMVKAVASLVGLDP